MRPTQSLVLFVFVGISHLASACDPGEASSWTGDSKAVDAGARDVSLTDAPDGDTADAATDAIGASDTAATPDAAATDSSSDSGPVPQPDAAIPNVQILSPVDGVMVEPQVEFSVAAEHVATVQIKVDDWPLSDPWDPASQSTLSYTLQDTGSPREVILYGYSASGDEIARDTIFVTVRPSWNCAAVACEEVDVTTSAGSMRAIDGCAFELGLQHPLSEGEALADRLLDRLEDESLGRRRSFQYVSEHLNRDARSGLSSAFRSRLSGLNPEGFRWNSGDDNVSYWMPQGITGSSDARDNGKVNGKKWILTAWFHKTDSRPTKGARLALADITDPSNIKYRLLLLVDPIEDANGEPTFKEASYDSGGALHVGGIVWYGDYLFVADTSQGFRIYDLSRIFSPTEYDTDKIGINGGKSSAHGYGYAVPRIARYRWRSGSCRAKFSFLGLDRSSDPPALINGGYDVSDTNQKVLVWPLNPATHLLEERGGTTRASQAAIIGQNRAQGAIRNNGYIYISSSSQDGNKGRLYKGRPGQVNSSVKWVYGAEDIYLQRDTGRIWTGAEHAGSRDVASIPLP